MELFWASLTAILTLGFFVGIHYFAKSKYGVRDDPTVGAVNLDNEPSCSFGEWVLAIAGLLVLVLIIISARWLGVEVEPMGVWGGLGD